MILTSDNRQLTNGSSIYLTDLSIGLSATRTLFIVAEQPLEQLSCSTRTNGAFSLFKVDNGIVDVVQSVSLDDLDVHQSGGRFIYVLNIMAFSETEGFFTEKVSIDIDGAKTEITLKVDIVGLDTNLAVALQNMKVFITDEWMSAMYETEVGSKATDFVIYNRKLREYLMNITNLETLKGTYKGLQSALNFFGFGELLDIKEHWLNKEQGDYKYTSIRNAILTKVDKSLTGYKKTNQMSLVYQINQESGVDGDSLPIYINVLDDTERILAKLWVLEQILQREFMYTNTHIVDIIGEFQAVVGLEFGFLLNQAAITDVNLNEDSFGKIEKIGESMESQHITNHNLLLYKNFILREHNNILETVDGVTDNSVIDIPDFYEVKEIVEMGSEESEPFEILTNFHNVDCAMMHIDVELVGDTYQSFKYFIMDDNGEIVFSSQMRGIETIRNNRISCAIKKLGEYKMLCYFFDYNGGFSVLSTNTRVLPVSPKIQLGVYSLDGNPIGLDQWSTFETFKEGIKSPVAQNLDGSLNINTWDSVENNPQQIIARYYANVYDQMSTWTSMNQLNSIPISSYGHLPMNIHGYSYATIILDIIPNVGQNFVGLAYFENEDFESISLEWDGVEPIDFWLTRMAGLLNDQTDSKLGDFTWSLHKYSNNPLATIDEAHYVIVGKSKEQSLMSSYIRVQNTGQVRGGEHYQENYFKGDVRAWSTVDAITRFKFTPTIGDLSMRIGEHFEKTEDMDFPDMASFREKLDGFIEGIDGVWAIYLEDEVLVYSNSDIYLDHSSIGGIQMDVVRAKDSNSIKEVFRGTQITVGEPIFAHIKRETLQNIHDPKWTLVRENDGAVVSEQNSIWFRCVLTKGGSYSLKFQYKDPMGETKEFNYGGCFVVV